MPEKTLNIKTSISIQRPAESVFEAIVDPVKMSNYFIESSTGRMEQGKILTWKFPEFNSEFPVRVEKAEANKFISFYWDDVDGKSLLVDITLIEKSENDTHIIVTEKERENDEAGLKWLKGHTEGWANFLACLKAYLEYGINLRKGAFDPEQLAKDFSELNTTRK